MNRTATITLTEEASSTSSGRNFWTHLRSPPGQAADLTGLLKQSGLRAA